MQNLIYKFFKNVNNEEKELMSIESTVELQGVIEKYSNYYKKDPIMTERNTSIHNFTADYRRVLSDILYSLYIDNSKSIDSNGEIVKISINGKEYTNIKEVRIVSESYKRVIFSATCTEQSKEPYPVTMCIPLAMFSISSSKYAKNKNFDLGDNDLISDSEEGFYYLKKDQEFNLQFYNFYVVYNNQNREPGEYIAYKYVNEHCCIIDLFFGSRGNKKGIYYFFKNELVPMYELYKDGENYKINWTNIRQCMIQDEIKIDEFEVETDLDVIDSFYEMNSFEKNLYTEFEDVVVKYIWHKFVFVDDEVTLMGKKQEDGTYVYTIASGSDEKENIQYCTTPHIFNNPISDFYYRFDQFGKIVIDNFCMELDVNKNDWIIGDCVDGFAFRVEKEVFFKHINIFSFPDTPNKKDIKKSDDYIKNYLNDNADEFLNLKNDIEDYLKNHRPALRKLVENSVSEFDLEVKEIKNVLYPYPRVADMEVVKVVYEAKKEYEETNLMPNFAIFGGPGSGKSTLVKGIAKCLLGEKYSDDQVLYKCPSDLKGSYIGGTGERVFDLMVGASEKKQIVFVDEAYDLQKDDFGREAVNILLPLLTGDRIDMDAPASKLSNVPRHYSFGDRKNVPPIWLAGYEDKLRRMLNENPGLYRRVKKITLSAPTVGRLFDYLLLQCEEKNASLRQKIKANEDEIRKYFSWAIAPENIDFFANYAGVEEFYKTCKLRIDDNDNKVAVEETIQDIIDEKKKEIKNQYKAILEEDKKIHIKVQNDIKVVLDDIKGNDDVVSYFREIVDWMMDKEACKRKGIKVPKGALLEGPPGTGKTMLARALTGEIQKRCLEREKQDVKVGFLPVVSSELNHSDKIKALFRQAEEYDMSIVFIDEIDAIGINRAIDSTYENCLVELLSEMDGFETRKSMFVLAATNNPDIIDPALKRPGRFDRIVKITNPDFDGRVDILKSAFSKLMVFNDENIEAWGRMHKDDEENKYGPVEKLARELAKRTCGFSPAELLNLVNEAAILYEHCNKALEQVNEADNREKYKVHNSMQHRVGLKKDISEIDKFEKDVFEQLERIIVGNPQLQKKELEFQADENKGCSATAIHEVGHAMVSILLGLEPFESITILPRGDALGYVKQNSSSELRTKKDFLNYISICLGGRVAEELFYEDNISIGAVKDIQMATKCAEEMVAIYGMSDLIGMMAAKEPSKGYLGEKSKYTCSEAFRYEVDNEVRKLLLDQMAIVRGMLKCKKDVMEKLARYVFENEVVTGEEFEKTYKDI